MTTLKTIVTDELARGERTTWNNWANSNNVLNGIAYDPSN